MGERPSYRCGVAATIDGDALEGFVLYLVVELVTEEEQLLQLLGVQVLPFQQPCCLGTAGSDGQHGCFSDI